MPQASSCASSMDAEQKVTRCLTQADRSPSGALTEGTRHQRQGRVREDGSIGSPTVQCGTEHKQSVDEASGRGIEVAGSTEVRFPFGGRA